jgi:LmbE family N-acetylglucosaminyl deacetylase
MKIDDNDNAVLYIPDGADPDTAISRTTHLGIGAHQDDLEIMATEGILKCYERDDRWFGGVIVNDGSSAPRTGEYADFTNEEIAAERIEEQKRAADLGEYGFQVLLGYSNDETKDPTNQRPMNDLRAVIDAAGAETIYTHNLLDKHYAHVAVTIQTIRAIRGLDKSKRPKRLIGCEVWRDLDWLVGDDKVVMDVSGEENLQRKLLEVFGSQIAGKRYDLAAMGRRVAHATYLDPHENDAVSGAIFGMDLTPLIEDDDLDIEAYARGYIERLNDAVIGQIRDLI